MIRVADYIMKRIQEEGVKHLFYVPGGQCVYLTDALRRNENLKDVSVHHEQTAAMAALSYAKYNGRLGACLVTTGCAGTNTITGVLHAWQDSVPVIIISGQQNREQTISASGLPLRQVGVQEADIVTLVSSITKYAVMLTEPSDVAWHLDKALYTAMDGRKGPVWLDVPLDIQNAMVDESKLKRFVPEKKKSMADNLAGSLEYVKECLHKAKRPVLLAGQGVRHAQAGQCLKKLLEKINLPVVFTRASIDLLPTAHPLNFGVAGSFGASRYANFIVQNSDLLISIGSRLSIDTTGTERTQFAREAKIIAIDIDETEHQKKGVPLERFIHSDAGEFIEGMLGMELEKVNAGWLEKCRHWREIFRPYDREPEETEVLDIKYFLAKLSEHFPENSTIISDAGMTGVATPANCLIKESDRSIHSFAQGEMGFCLPGAIGAACASDGMVITISGDGSFMMNLQELQTLVRNQFNIKTVIINNNGYSGVRHGQKAHFRGKTIGTDPSNGLTLPDYGRLAEAFDIPYYKVETSAWLEQGIQRCMERNGPFILEAVCDPEQFDLHNALVMYGKRKFGFRPIEDQSPFIERDTFFEEMIVEPMETSYGKPV